MGQQLIWWLDDWSTSIRWDDEEPGERAALGVDVAPRTRTALRRLLKRGIAVRAVVDAELTSTSCQVIAQYLDGAEVSSRGSKREDHDTGFLVSSDRTRRAAAAARGCTAAPSLVLAELRLERGALQFCEITGPRDLLDGRGAAVYFREPTDRGRWRYLAAMAASDLPALESSGAQVRVLDIDISVEDPVFVHIAATDREAWRTVQKRKVLLREPERALVALSQATPNDALGVHGVHGHYLHLVPDGACAATEMELRQGWRSAQLQAARLVGSRPRPKVRRQDLALDFKRLRCLATAASFQADVERFSGVAALDAGGPIASRHIAHADNARVVSALLRDLRAMGYCAYRHTFTHAGRTLHNVIADLPGRGDFQLAPSILDRLRAILIRWPLPDPPDPWRRAIDKALGPAWLAEHGFGGASPIELRLQLEAALGLYSWYPWWWRKCPIAGPGAELVLVGCHIDSTAASTAGYDPATDAAPGADDDASGIAATLAAARQLRTELGRLRHTVRFCFFNAEEQGLVGSHAYAAQLASAGAPVRAVVCSDMIGYNSNADRIFEVHAGYTDPSIRDASLPIANTIAAWGAALGSLAPAQIHSGTSSSGGLDRTLYDGAINRSDHASFHQCGFPAVVVSEDFFANQGGEPAADPNPNYHRSNDTVIDSTYGRDIACVITHAVRELAH